MVVVATNTNYFIEGDILNKELIKITTKDGQNLVSAKELHGELKVKSKFADWIKNRITKYGFVENEDYTTLSKILENGGKEKDYIITTDMAKELCMVENNEEGRIIRKYFIQCEKNLKNQITLPSHKAYINEIETVKSEIGLIDVLSQTLRLNDNSKLLLITKSFENHNINTNLLPIYTPSKGILKSATELLKQHNVGISVIKFNKILVEKNILKECERHSTKDKNKVKKFKSIVNTYYGENNVSQKNPNETQPLYYEDKFKELLNTIGL